MKTSVVNYLCFSIRNVSRSCQRRVLCPPSRTDIDRCAYIFIDSGRSFMGPPTVLLDVTTLTQLSTRCSTDSSWEVYIQSQRGIAKVTSSATARIPRRPARLSETDVASIVARRVRAPCEVSGTTGSPQHVAAIQPRNTWKASTTWVCGRHTRPTTGRRVWRLFEASLVTIIEAVPPHLHVMHFRRPDSSLSSGQ